MSLVYLFHFLFVVYILFFISLQIRKHLSSMPATCPQQGKSTIPKAIHPQNIFESASYLVLFIITICIYRFVCDWMGVGPTLADNERWLLSCHVYATHQSIVLLYIEIELPFFMYDCAKLYAIIIYVCVIVNRKLSTDWRIYISIFQKKKIHLVPSRKS